MQTGWYGNKTQMIDQGAKKYADNLSCVTIDDIERLIKVIKAYENDNDTYNADVNRCRLNYVIERAAKEGVK